MKFFCILCEESKNSWAIINYGAFWRQELMTVPNEWVCRACANTEGKSVLYSRKRRLSWDISPISALRYSHRLYVQLCHLKTDKTGSVDQIKMAIATVKDFKKKCLPQRPDFEKPKHLEIEESYQAPTPQPMTQQNQQTVLRGRVGNIHYFDFLIVFSPPDNTNYHIQLTNSVHKGRKFPNYHSFLIFMQTANYDVNKEHGYLEHIYFSFGLVWSSEPENWACITPASLILIWYSIDDI